MKALSVPSPTVARLPVYAQALDSLQQQGVQRVSSQRIAESTGIDAAKIRRDLSYFGAFGTRGVGYNVGQLLGEISRQLGLSRSWPVALVGCGRLGSALAAYISLTESRFRIVAIVDPDPRLVGTVVGGLVVMPPTQLAEVVNAEGIEIGIIATPVHSAQKAADALVASGVTALLNFAPASLSVPPAVSVRHMDVIAEMQILAFHQNAKDSMHLSYHRRRPRQAETKSLLETSSPRSRS